MMGQSSARDEEKPCLKELWLQWHGLPKELEPVWGGCHSWHRACHICNTMATVLLTSTTVENSLPPLASRCSPLPTGGSLSASLQESASMHSGDAGVCAGGWSRCTGLIPPKRGQWCLRTHRHTEKTVVYSPAARLSQPADRNSPQLLAQAEQSTELSLSHTLS